MAVIQVWMASHIKSIPQIQTLKRAIESILIQLSGSNVWISYSIDDNVPDALRARIPGVIRRIISEDVHILKSPAKLLQFEHLFAIDDYPSRENADYIAFCDDDDLYYPEKLTKQLHLAEIYGYEAVNCLSGMMTIPEWMSIREVCNPDYFEAPSGWGDDGHFSYVHHHHRWTKVESMSLFVQRLEAI